MSLTESQLGSLKPKQIGKIRLSRNQRGRLRNRALVELAIDSKLHGCKLMQRIIGDIASGGQFDRAQS